LAKEDAMSKAVAINGSPRKEQGYTAMVLTPFIQGMMDAGSDVKDDMQLLYPKLREADILILATPVYIPLPGEMQDFINRLCPLVKPLLETREGRTRARFHRGVRIQKIVLVSTGGWWEKENFGTVVRIAEELAENVSVEFAGAVLRPHASLMKQEGEVTEEGEAVLDEVRRAGHELVKDGVMSQKTLKAISRPLISEDELRRIFNEAL
jgi:multimeric flavodoxin WrbA